MECKARVKSIARDFRTGKVTISLELDDVTTAMLESIPDKDLRLTLKEWKNKRSLDANALMWKCLGDIAAELKADKWDIYLQMLKRYGKFTHICVKPQAVEAVKAQWRESEVLGEVDINGQKAIQILCYFGSSSYDTKEFSVLLDGVISEMEEMGLETPAVEELKGALTIWEKNFGK